MAKRDDRALPLIERLQSLLDDQDYLTALGAKDRKKILASAPDLARRLRELQRELDPVRWEELFDPTDPRAVAEVLANILEERDLVPLGDIRRFWGSGVYAIYYEGGHSAYRDCVAAGVPLYVGKADPADENAATVREQGDRLYRRLRDHRRSIAAVEEFSTTMRLTGGIEPLALAAFKCRYFVVTSAYAAAVEAALIHHYGPVWNDVCPGFGKHGDSHKTRVNTRSDWDTLHPGRTWATKPGNKKNPKSPRAIGAAVLKYAQRYRG
jgi:Eco29kI restriction endonuclease